MQELRQSPRKTANDVLVVADQITGSHIGRVVNISAEGLMLLSEEPVITGSVYRGCKVFCVTARVKYIPLSVLRTQS
ncbi:MAG: hypothetical protein KZQ81_09995 [Candidatus Thiodiazotropha sp. (ex Rostrolucina anterorostrata)]|nr:hypothetical protein [Candidatus Thiodiazotropha sp. (ex Rostrolucina anterorostrata)]